MGRTARQPKDEVGGEVTVADYDLAERIYVNDVAPAQSSVAEFAQEVSTAIKAVKKLAGMIPAAFKAVNAVMAMEDAKGDKFLRDFTGYLNKRKGRTVLTFHGDDLVDQMQSTDGDTPSGPAPVVARPKPKLVTIPSDGNETDLVDAAFEAPPEEIAKQEGRKKAKPGTGAAAIESMNAAARSEDDGIEG